MIVHAHPGVHVAVVYIGSSLDVKRLLSGVMMLCRYRQPPSFDSMSETWKFDRGNFDAFGPLLAPTML